MRKRSARSCVYLFVIRSLLIGCCLALAACAPAPGVQAASPRPSAQTSERTVPSGTPAVTGRAVGFERIGRAPPGGASPVRGRTTAGPTIVAATTPEEVGGLLTNDRVGTSVLGLPPLPDGGAYVAAFAGAKGSAGFAISVVDVRAGAGTLTLWTSQTGPGDTLLPLVSYPVDVVLIAASELARGTLIEMRDAQSGALLARAAYCGSTRQLNPLTPYDPSGADCVWSAFGRGITAQWLRRTLTIEGGPIIRTLRAVPGGLSEVSVDDRGDGFAHAPGVRSWACAQLARSSTQGPNGAVAWFSLSACTGNGPEVDVL